MQAIEDRYKVHCGLQQLFTQHAGCAVPALPQGGGYDFTLLAQKGKAAPRRCTGLTAQLAALLAGQTTRLETTCAADTAACTARAEVTAYGSIWPSSTCTVLTCAAWPPRRTKLPCARPWKPICKPLLQF